MEFCSGCKNLMLPKQVGEKTVLVCRGCGHEKKKVKVGEYKITEATTDRHGEITVIEEDTHTNTEEQRRYNNDLYGDATSGN